MSIADRNILKLVRDLGRRKARERRGIVVLEGRRLVEDAWAAGAAVEGLLLAEDQAGVLAPLADAAAARGVPVQTVERRDFDTAADTETPGGVLAIARWEPRALEQLPKPGPGAVVLVLDALQDPGNVGTMIRTGHALGALATVALDGTADTRGAKALRAAMGSHFHHAVVETDYPSFVAWAQAAGLRMLLAAMDGVPVPEARGDGPMALVVGNEGRGLRADWSAVAHRRVAVAMRGDAESLNAAVAAGILLHELVRDVR
jgi:TrmH family RNA methyltransferase